LPTAARPELIIPDRGGEAHTAYFRDADGLHPIEIADNVKRDQLVTPTVVSKRVEKPHARHRSWEKEVMIIGEAPGAGAAVGRLTGGKKGAGIGAGPAASAASSTISLRARTRRRPHRTIRVGGPVTGGCGQEQQRHRCNNRPTPTGLSRTPRCDSVSVGCNS